MANPQDVLDSTNPYGQGPDGEVATAWGGKMGSVWSPDNYYTGGWTTDQYGDRQALDPAAYAEAIRKSAEVSSASSGRGQDVARYRSMGEAAMGRTAPTIDYGQANNYLGQGAGYLNRGAGYLNSAVKDRGMALQSREQQMGALALQQQAAMGQAPSQAELLGRNMIDQGLQSQLAVAAGARGGAMGQAAAMRGAQQGAAAYQQQGMNNLSALRAQEMASARDAWQAGATGMRGQDYIGAQNATAMAGQAGQLGQTSASMGQTAAQMQQYQALMETQQRQLNQNNQQFYEQLGWNTNNAALNAGLGRTSNMQQADQFNRQMENQQDQMNQQMWSAAIGGGAAMGSAALMKRADGGPVVPGQPTLVGEQGPELVVNADSSGGYGPGQPVASVVAAPVPAIAASMPVLEVDPESAARGDFLEQYAKAHGLSIKDAHEKLMGARDRMNAARYTPARSPYVGMDASGVGAVVEPSLLGRVSSFFGGARAGGGPVARGKAYVVGENGPEVIVPAEKGMVLPAHHPMSMAAAAKLSSQADREMAGMRRSLGSGPSVGQRQITLAPQVISSGPEENMTPGHPSARSWQAPARNMSMATDTAPMVLADYPQAYLMGGREDPYTADPNYMPPTWGVGRYDLPVRQDPYARGGR